MPPGVQALLSGRLERLDRDERLVVGAASVIGTVFYRDAVHVLVPDLPPARVSVVLHDLSVKELVLPARTDVSGQDAFAFRHQIIRDVAYERLSKTQRAALHERFADWYESAVAGKEQDEGDVLGYHLERAHQYRVLLGPADQRARALADRAAHWLAKAGWRASALGDTSAGVALRRRALDLMDPTTPGRATVLAELGDALMWRGQFEDAESALAEAVASPGDADRRPRMLARLSQLRLAFQVDPEADFREIEREALASVEAFEASGDHFGAARALRVAYSVRWGLCQVTAMRSAAERGYEHDRQARDPHYPQDDLVGVLVSLTFGPTPSSDALAQGLPLLERMHGHAGAEANAMCFLGQLRAMLGQTDAAIEMIQRGVSAREKLGDVPGAAMARAEGLGYFVAHLAGDWETAEREFRRGYDRLLGMGDKNYLAVTAGWLAHTMLEQGRDDDAATYAAASRAAAARDWMAAQVLWRGAEAVVQARRGRLEAGEALAREAVSIAMATDRVDTRADAQLDLVAVLRLGGQSPRGREDGGGGAADLRAQGGPAGRRPHPRSARRPARRRVHRPVSPAPSRVRISADLRRVAELRAAVRRFAASAGAAPSTVDDVVQAVDEAATNVIVHGYAGAPGWIGMTLFVSGDCLVATLEDAAPSFNPVTAPDTDMSVPALVRGPRGMGVHLMRLAMDTLEYEARDGGGNRLSMTRALAARPEEDR